MSRLLALPLQWPRTVVSFAILVLATAIGYGQPARSLNPEELLVKRLKKNRIVMLGEYHGSRQLHELVLQLIANRSFVRESNDIVVEGGNPLFQKIMDRYLAGEPVLIEELRKFGRNGLGLGIGPEKPGLEFYAAVRAANKKHHLRLRILGGEAPVDWSKISKRADLEPLVPRREEYYAQAVRTQVVNKHRRALLIMGLHHFRRKNGQPQFIESEIRKAGINPWLVLVGSDVKNSYDDVEPRFRRSPWPAIYETKKSWVGATQASGPLTGGSGGRPPVEGTLSQAADAFLYLGPNDKLTQFRARLSDVLGTSYAREIERRLTIVFGRVPPDFLPKDDREEWPLYLPSRSTPPPIPPHK